MTEMKEGPASAGETERLWIRSAVNEGLKAGLLQREWEAEMGGEHGNVKLRAQELTANGQVG